MGDALPTAAERWTLGVYYASDGDGGDGAAFVATALPALAARLAARAWAPRLRAFSLDVARNDFFDLEGEHGPRLVDRGVPSPMLALYPPSPDPGAGAPRRVVFTGRPAPPFALRPPNPVREATTDELVAWIERHVGAPAETGRDTAPADAAL